MGAGTAYYWLFFSSLFPLSEFRDWVTWPASWDYKRNVLTNIFTWQRPEFARDVTMLYVRSVGELCGPQLRCLNLWMLLPSSISAALLYILARQMRLTRGFAAAAVLCWWFSAPVADAFGWQATVNDRLALLFLLAAFCLSLGILEAPLGARTFLTGNVVVPMALILAYNSKESAWFLAPSLVLAALILRRGGWRRRLGGTLFFCVPLAYASYHNLRYFLVGLPERPYWGTHIFGGEISRTLPRFVMGLFGLPADLLPLPIGLILGLMWMLAGRPRSREKMREATRCQPATAAGVLWCFLTLALAMAIPLRAKYHPLYYLYLPQAFFALGMMGLLQLLLDASSAHQRAPRATRGVLATVAAALLMNFQLNTSRHPRRIAAYSENFVQTLETLAAELGPARLGSVVFVAPSSAYYAHMFCEGPSRRSLLRYAVAATDLSAIPEGSSKLLGHSECEGNTAQAAEANLPICVYLNEQMAIESVRRGGEELCGTWQPPARDVSSSPGSS